ncbi:MAG: hypothetical protein ACPG49_12820, partial [Chitinophagales bacterium]
MKQQQETIWKFASILCLQVFFLLLSSPNILQAQTNLVPNPSFEDTIACPSGLGFLSATAQEW